MPVAADSLENGANVSVHKDLWFFPEELRNGLETFDLAESVINEALTCAWEYSRCVIPEWTNWDKYMAFNRTIIVAVIAEFRGDLIPEDCSDHVLGYDLEDLLGTLFGETTVQKDMSREFRSFLLVAAEKSSKGMGSELFTRYLNALVQSPKQWFRLRDCDALARYTMAGALACNDITDIPFSEDEWQLLAELGCTLYDAVAFYKHRAEGETNNTFGYFGGEMRVESYRLYRETLWALDVAWAKDPNRRCILNFLRFFGGPIHMTCRRYRFVEDGLRIGKPETDKVVEMTRDHFKLWNRVEATETIQDEGYAAIIAQSDKLLFDGFDAMLESSAERDCSLCFHAAPRGAQETGKFGGVQLCDLCEVKWHTNMRAFGARFEASFPEVSAFSRVPEQARVAQNPTAN